MREREREREREGESAALFESREEVTGIDFNSIYKRSGEADYHR